MALSTRAISRCVGVARTIASLGASERVEKDAVSEALQFRVPGGEAEAGAGDAERARVA